VKKIMIAALGLLAIAGGVLFYLDRTEVLPIALPTAKDAPVAASPHALFMREPGRGANRVWRFEGNDSPVIVDAQGAGPEWTALAFAVGGWGGDNLLLWRNSTGGALLLWRLGADGKLVSSEAVPYSGDEWRVVAVVDADGDRDADLVWSNRQGELAVWTLEDGKVQDKSVVGRAMPDGALAQAGDFDGDGRAELFVRNGAQGVNEVLALDGTKRAAVRRIAGAGPEWTLIGTGALDAEPGDDLLWRSLSGQLVGWSGADAARPIAIARAASPGWDFVGLVDTDADGRSELFWRQSQGNQAGAWRLDAGNAIVDVKLPSLPAGWTSVPLGFVQP
jgi:hypothetical protein